MLLFTLLHQNVDRTGSSWNFDDVTFVAVDSSIVKSRSPQTSSLRVDRFPFTECNLLTLHFNDQLPSYDSSARASDIESSSLVLRVQRKAAVSLWVYYTAELGRGFTRWTLHRTTVPAGCGDFTSTVHRKGRHPVGDIRSLSRKCIREYFVLL